MLDIESHGWLGHISMMGSRSGSVVVGPVAAIFYNKGSTIAHLFFP